METSSPRGTCYNAGKLRVDLIPPQIILALAIVYTYGAAKYADRNWEIGIPYSERYASGLRHNLAFWNNEDIDPDSGLPHCFLGLWNAACLTHFFLFPDQYQRFDDRPKYRGASRMDAIIADLPAMIAEAEARFKGVTDVPRPAPTVELCDTEPPKQYDPERLMAMMEKIFKPNEIAQIQRALDIGQYELAKAKGGEG